ncbi:MAG: peptide-methionine (S)-S-oxide reductase MsrA [Candidatus Micrarchaeia archaeon]
MDDAWKYRPTAEQYRVMRQKGTEAPFCNASWNEKREGKYYCAACGSLLFQSGKKFDSGTGWPSFVAPAKKGAIALRADRSFGMERDEAICAKCESHLGHVFDDGPRTFSQSEKGVPFCQKAKRGSPHRRFCMNSIAMDFEEKLEGMESAIFAAGCFWGVQAKFGKLPGVARATAGYCGGWKRNPTYKEVCTGKTGHAECVLVEYDAKRTGFDALLGAFFSMHNPTTKNRQGLDIGEQYRSAIFWKTPGQRRKAIESIAGLKKRGTDVVTEVKKAGAFWRAEDYHQDYLRKHKDAACRLF